MTIPAGSEENLRDRAGHPIRAGMKVRLAGVAEPVEVQVVDPRYGVLVVLVPARAGQMARMVRAAEVEAV